MLVAFILIQCAVNAALVAGLFRLLKQREAISEEARQREARLETLAAELCALGRDMARQDTSVAGPPPAADSASGTVREADVAPAPPPVKTSTVPETSDRLQGAVSLLRQGVGLERVAVETALLEGEIQVLRNLARGTRSSTTVQRVGRAGTAAGREAAGAGRRRARGARLETLRPDVSAEPAPTARASGRDAQPALENLTRGREMAP
jgi:hypothetical protein